MSGTTTAGAHVVYVGECECEKASGTNGNWKSRKFWSAFGSSAAVLCYAGTARALDWITEGSMEYLITACLITISVYCGFNLAEKLGGLGGLLGKAAPKADK